MMLYRAALEDSAADREGYRAFHLLTNHQTT